MQNNSARRASIILGIFMAFVLVAGAVIPLITGNTNTTAQQITPTEVPIPTFPPAPASLSTVTFEKVYLHPTGIFSIGQPEGWTSSEPNKGANIAQLNLVNNDTLSVLDAYIEDAGVPVTAETLGDRFTRDAINASWARFNQWEETNRSFNAETGRLQIDFRVTLNRQTYAARQQAWTDGQWVYVVRVLTPENATEYLRYLLDNFSASLNANTIFQGTPLDWTAYYDNVNSHIIRYPSEWSITDTAPGRPTSIASNNGVLLRVESQTGVSINDEAAARAFVEDTRVGTTVTTVQPIQRLDVSGFAVSYTFATIDGDIQSGLVNLLTSADGILHIADLRFPAADIDLNALNVEDAAVSAEVTPEATADAPVLAVNDASMIGIYRDLATVMSSFYVIAPIPLTNNAEISGIEPTVVAPEVTLEVTAEADATAEAEATTEPEATTEADATAEATAAS